MTEKKKTGFAVMDKEKQKEIASKGGKAAHAKGTRHKWTKEEAAIAGSKGGKNAHAKGTAHKFKSKQEQRKEHDKETDRLYEKHKDLTTEKFAELLEEPEGIPNTMDGLPAFLGSTEREMDLAFQVEIAEMDQRAGS